jgi:flagellar hook-length control protein FliK
VKPPAAGIPAPAEDTVGDVLSGPARQAVIVTAADVPIAANPQQAAVVIPEGVATGSVALDIAGTQKLLATADPSQAPNTAVDGARSDAAAPAETATANLARAAEMMSHGPRHAAGVSRDVIATPVRDPHWAQEFGARVAMMVRGGESTASLQLAPADLGPVDVNVVVRDSQATVHFGAAQADTRALIEASIPRLREMLAAQGFHLMDASVSQGFARQPRSESVTPIRVDGEPETEVRATAHVAPLGLLDTYA